MQFGDRMKKIKETRTALCVKEGVWLHRGKARLSEEKCKHSQRQKSRGFLTLTVSK